VTRDAILALISRCLGEVLHTDPPAITEATRLVDDAGLDSLSSLELLMALEEAAGVSFDPDTLDLGRFPTAGDLADFVGAARVPA
jgi:acyl carrier protein